MNNNIHKTIESKQVLISQLPESLARARLETLVKNSNESYVIVVAKLSSEYNNWLAYIGYPDIEDIEEGFLYGQIAYHCNTIRTDVQVLAKGDVLDASTAKALFPNWCHLKYRME